MKRLIQSIIKYKWLVAILIPLLTLTFATQLKELRFEGSYRIWFGEESSTLKQYDTFRSVFGNDESLTISFKSPDGIFTKESLGVVERITQKLWQTPYIARVDSITNYQYVHADPHEPDEVIVEDFIESVEALSSQDLKEKERIALSEDSLVKRLLSTDAKTTTIAARLVPKAGETPEISLKIKALAHEIIAPEEALGYTFYLNGMPIINSSFITIAQRDGAIFIPAAIVAIMLLLLVVYRRFSSMFVSVCVVVFTFLIVLSAQVLLGYKLNNFTVNMPVFVMAIGIADAMHLLWIYTVARKKGQGNEEAILYSVQKNFLPLLFTSLTTAVGFASLSISSVVPIKTLGIATATAALLAFVLTLLFVPALLAILNPKIKPEQESTQANARFSNWYGKFIVKHDKSILAFTTLFFLLLAIGITKVRVDSNTVNYFTDNVPWRQAVFFTQENISGPIVYEVVVDTKIKDGIKNPDFLKAVEQFYKDFYTTYPKEVRHISSLLEVIKKFNEVMLQEKGVPNSQELVAQYLLLYSLSLPQGMEINDQMDIDEQRFRITVAKNITDTSKDLEMIAWSEAWWEQNTPYSAQVNGQASMFAHMQSDVTDTLIDSITLAISVVSLMMIIIFRTIKLLPLFVLPNILPIALVVGVMGWVGIDIDIGVAIAGAIIIGVAVDDSIHFLVKYFEARKKGFAMAEALSYVMQYAGSAILFTTAILSLAFSIFVFSDFYPNMIFGVVTASALIIAVITDLLTLPAILSIMKKRKLNT